MSAVPASPATTVSAANLSGSAGAAPGGTKNGSQSGGTIGSAEQARGAAAQFLKTRATQDAANDAQNQPEPGQPDADDPTRRAYIGEDEIDDEEPDGDAVGELDDGEIDDADGEVDIHQDPAERGQRQPADLSATAWGALAKTFNVDPSQVTSESREAMVNDVRSILAQAKGGQQPAAGSPQPTAAESRPSAPSAPSSGQVQPPAPVPVKGQAGSVELTPLSDKQLAAFAEFGDDHAQFAKSHNALVQYAQQMQERLSGMDELQRTVGAMQGDLAWTRAQPVVSQFAEAQAKSGLPTVPPAELRALATDAAIVQSAKAQQGLQVSDEQALHMAYMARYGDQIKDQASKAEAKGRKEVIGSLQKKQRRFDVAGGPGGLPGNPAPADPKARVLANVKQYRRQEARVR